MEGIEIGKAIDAYGIAIVTGILLGLIVWLVRHFVMGQDKTMKDILNMFRVELKALHKDGKTNARLNRKGIRMTSALAEYLNKHFNGCVDKVNPGKKVKTNGRK